MPLLDFNVDLRSLERSLSHKCIVGLLRKMNHYTEAAQNTRGKRKRDIAKVLQKGGVIYAEQVRHIIVKRRQDEVEQLKAKAQQVKRNRFKKRVE